MRIEKGSDITKNVKIIEWIKNEILISVSDLFNLIFKGVKPIDDKLQNTLANIIMLTYLLGKRLGISFDEIDYKIKEKSKHKHKYRHGGGNNAHRRSQNEFLYGVAPGHNGSPEYCGIKQRRGQKRNRPKVICGKKHGTCNTAGVAAGAYLKNLIKKNKKEKGGKICRKNCKHGL